ncbi:hypothetical protein RhiirA4_459884 [Rhizophagus irregularis]|uniref:Uncharacterized protein n=1 Tax=Rhizophagus irregularis TaxID=588596 RepID=A0A2I1GFE1_9GLOM|nr:hypothetical protein RhiirA4_459884 [Rhizophagus irregularis]
MTNILNPSITYWCARTNEVIFGRVIEKNHFYNHHQTITFEHFTHITDSHPDNITSTPRSRPTYIAKCTGCHLSEHNIYHQNATNTCYITSLSNSTFIIQVSKSNLSFPHHKRPIYKCIKQYSTIKHLAIIDFNLRSSYNNNNNNTLIDPLLYRLQIDNSIELNLINILNKNLILQLILPISLHSSLLTISFKLSSFTNLEFYTDGSLSRDNEYQ